MSFILVRLLQKFSSFEHYPELRAPEFATPKEWKNAPGRKGIDNFFPKMTLTMYSGVSIGFLWYVLGAHDKFLAKFIGWPMDQGTWSRDTLILCYLTAWKLHFFVNLELWTISLMFLIHLTARLTRPWKTEEMSWSWCSGLCSCIS